MTRESVTDLNCERCGDPDVCLDDSCEDWRIPTHCEPCHPWVADDEDDA